MENISLRLPKIEESQFVRFTNNNETDFARLCSASEIEDSGLMLDDININGSFKSVNIKTGKIQDNIPEISERTYASRTVDSFDTFIKPVFELSEEDAFYIASTNETPFECIQTIFSDEYGKKFDRLYRNNALTHLYNSTLYNKGKMYLIQTFKYKDFKIAKVPNVILKNDKNEEHSWFLYSPVKGIVMNVDGKYIFIPNNILFSGISYRNLGKSVRSFTRERLIDRREK